MEYEFNVTEKIGKFETSASGDEQLDELAFIHLVQMKFVAKLVSSKKEGKRTIEVVLSFPDWSATDAAKSHCDRNLTYEGGKVVADYRGALDAADPGRRMAVRLRKLASGEKYSE
ncbi:hypothetical protein [Thiomonas intermedia]|uniref:hypothetical protein n=1 Tax=Thiomonas intermedia TaxID=926 RepID=UPI0009A49693|nr:hypothetical protein [Thiomonas intermedia]